MSLISKDDSTQLFAPMQTVDALIRGIRSNCHLWFDEDVTLRTLSRCYADCQKHNIESVWGSILLSAEGPYLMQFKVKPCGSVEWRGVD